MQGRGILISILLISLFAIYANAYQALPTVNMCPGPVYKTVYQPLRGVEGDVTDWVSQAALPENPGGVCDPTIVTATNEPPAGPCPYRGDCPHATIPTTGQFTRHDLDIVSFWGFNDANYLNFALQVYFFNATNLCPVGQTIYPERNVCYIAGINELAQESPAYYRACINSTGAGTIFTGTNGVCPTNFPVDYQFWWGPIFNQGQTRNRAFIFKCSDVNRTGDPSFQSFQTFVCNVPMDFSTINTLILVNGAVNPAIADFVYELSTSDFGVLQYDPNLFGSYLEVRLPLSVFGVTGPEYIGRRIYFHWQTGMVAPGYIQKHCPQADTPWYIPLLCDLNPTGLNITTGIPITYFPELSCNETYFFAPNITVDNRAHDPWPGEPPASPITTRTFCNPSESLFNCSYLGNNTLIAGTQLCCDPLASPSCQVNDPSCLTPDKDILGAWMITDGDWLYIRIDAPIGYNFTINNNAYISICFDVPGSRSGNSVSGDCGAGTLREVDYVLYYTQGRSASGPDCGGPLFCSLPGATFKNCSLNCNNDPSCCKADWGLPGYAPYVNNLKWCSNPANCFPSSIIELGIPLSSLGFNGSTGAVFNYSIRLSNQGLTPNVQYPQGGGAQIILPCRVPVPQTTGTTGIPLVNIGTYVWFDTNYNGQRDEAGTGVPGVQVTLTDCSGTVLGTTTTNANGQYLFTGVPSGTSYQVFFNPANLPAGTVFTKGNLGSDTTDSDVIDINTGAVECFFIPFGQNHLDADAGIYRPRCIGQFVWYDTNINGLQDAGEPGVSGIPVTLTGSNGSVVAQTVTNSTGGYLFCGLYPDNYTVTFQINGSMIYTPVYRAGNGANPDRDSDVNPAFVVGGTGIVQVPLPPSTDSLHNDAGVVSYGCLGDRVWYDTNLNGQRDAGEVGVGGITVYLLNGTTVIGTTTTNGTGYYLFCQLIPTNTGYSVTFVLPNPTYSFTLCRANGVPTDINSDACTISGLNGSTPLIPVPPGQTVLHNDAGIFGLGCIGQYVWYDTNLNGLQDAGEAGVSGIPVTLRFQNGSIAATQATNGTGYYLFCNLRPSNYTVQFQINPALFAFTPVFRAGNGANADFDSDINPFAVVNGLGTTPPIDLQPGTNSLHNDAGIISFGCIGDRVWYDYHVNGRQEADEGGVPGVTVYLLNGTTVVATTTTNATGYYLFCSLFPTTVGYRVTFVLPPNYVFTTCQAAGVPASQDSDACTISGRNGTTGLIPLLAGQVNLDIDAGMYNLSCVGDFVWLDSNTNGIQNGEAGIGGITVVLSYCNGTVVNSTVTNGNGGYSFCGLYPNNYQLQFNFNTSFYTCSPPLQGADRCVDSDITNCNTRTTTCFSLDTGVNDTCRDTGLYPFGRIGDFVWNDLNANGIQNAGEPGLAGLRVDLLNGTSLVQINQTTTDAQGIYSFAFLNPGQYRVRFYCPAGFVWTSYHIGSANLDSDANFALPNSTSATSPIITLPTGGVDLTWDAGCYQLSSIGDFIWNDLNANGQQDSGEPGVSINVTLNFVNASGTFPMRSQISNSNGFYLFDNLYPNSIIGGQYQVVFLINPIFYKFTTPFVGNTATDSNAVQQTPQIGLSNLITLPAAFNELTIDAGLIRLAQTTGTTGTTGINIYCFSCPFGNYISSFNFVSLGNLTMISSDIEGRAAAGGSAWLDNTGIGASVSSSSSCIPVKNPALASIVVQRRLQKNGGGSWGGNIYYGLASSVITAQSMDSGCFAVLNATAFNWTQIADYLLTLSDRLNTGADFLATGFPYYYPGPKSVYLNGQAPSSTNREIFRVHWPSVPTGGSVAWDLSVPNTVDTIIINVNGTNINFTSSMSNNMDAYKNRIIWNFWQATKITLNGAFKGALLAPLADVNGVDGLLEGQVFVKSWVGKMEIHYVKFIGCIPFISLAAGADPTCVSV